MSKKQITVFTDVNGNDFGIDMGSVAFFQHFPVEAIITVRLKGLTIPITVTCDTTSFSDLLNYEKDGITSNIVYLLDYDMFKAFKQLFGLA